VREPVKAVYYDGLTSKPHEALVSVREPNSLEVEVDRERFHWPLEHKGMQWERNGDMLRLSFGEHPRKVVIVRDALFIKSFAMRMQLSGRRGVYDRTLSVARRGPWIFFIAVAALLVAGYLWVLPWTAERLAMLTPRSFDEQLGRVAFEQMSVGMTIDEERSGRLQAFGDRLKFSPHYQLEYHVVDDPMVNAFALPGGHIVVFTGILDRMDEPEELAALLAHEATHVEERHSTRMMVRSLAGYLFLSLLLGDVNAIVAVAAENADKLRNMSYGRALESEADGVGTHPLTKDRMEKARQRATDLGNVDATDPELVSLFEGLKAPPTDQEEGISPSDPAP
jgi:Zn-dependent protease with chaperone function